MDFLQVVQHARQHVAWAGGLQEQAQRRIELAEQPPVAPVGRKQFVEFFERQRLARERVDHDLAHLLAGVHAQLDEKVAWE